MRFLQKYVPVFESIVYRVNSDVRCNSLCQELMLIKMYELCTIYLEFDWLIVPKQIKLTRLIIPHNFGTWRYCCFLTSEYFPYQHKIIAYVDGDNVEVYVEIFLVIVNGFQPLVVNRKCSVLDFVSVLDPSLKTPFFRPTCIFKYFDFVDRLNLQTDLLKLYIVLDRTCSRK